MTDVSDLCTFLEWDTEFFGKRIARIDQNALTDEQAQVINRWANENNIACMYYLADFTAHNILIAEKFGYSMRDVRVDLTTKLPHKSVKTYVPDTYALDVATDADFPDLSPIMDDLYTHSRFTSDPHFSNQSTDAMFRMWLRKSLQNTATERVFVYRESNKAIAFLICKLQPETAVGNMSLMGILPNARGKDLASGLVAAGLDYFVASGMTSSNIVTQVANIASQRVFQKFGYRTQKVSIWYHKWFI